MTNLTDDPTSYLVRDADVLMILLATSVTAAMDLMRQYGVSIQVNMIDPAKGIRVVVNQSDAANAIAMYPAATPWAIVSGRALATTYEMLRGFFGEPTRMDKAVGMVNKGIAWRPAKTTLVNA